MANGTPENLSQEQADKILNAPNFEEKRKLALDMGFSSDIVDKLDPEARTSPQEISQEEMAEIDASRPEENIPSGPEAVSQPAPDLSPEAEEIPFEEGDVPLQQEVDQGEQEEDVPVDWTIEIDEYGGKAPDDLENLRLVQSAVIQNYLDNTPLIEGYLQYRGTQDKQNLRDTLVDVKKAEDLQAVRDLFLEDPGVSPEDIMSEAQVTDLMQMEIEEEHTGPVAKGNAYADALAQGRIEEAAQRQLATNAALYESVVRPLAEDIGFWDQGKAFMKDLIPGVQLLQNKDITNTFFDAEDSLKKMMGRFQTLPPEEKRLVFPELKNHLVEQVGKTEAVGVLSRFLDPAGEFDFEDFSAAWAGVDAVDASAVAGSVFLKVLKAGKAAHSIQALKTADRSEEASDISAVSALDETGQTARDAGIDRFVAHDNALPFVTDNLSPLQTNELSTKIQQRIRDFQRQRQQTTQEIAAGTSWKREQAPLTPEQTEEVAVDRALSRDGIENAEVVNRTDEGFELRYDVTEEVVQQDDSIATRKVRTERLPIRYNSETGQPWEVDDRGVARGFLESNTSLAGDSNLKADIDRALRLDTASTKVAGDLLKLQREALKPVLGSAVIPSKRNPFLGARKSLAKIDEVMRLGDKESTVYNTTNLKKMGLNDNEIAAYYNVRDLFDGLYDLRNFEVRRDLVKQGFRNITTRNGEFHIGHPYRDSASANRALSQISESKDYAWVDDLEDVQRLDETDMEDMYNNGYRLTRMREGFRTEKAGKVNFAFVREDQIDTLPQTVLKKKEGYVPRAYDKAAYFVKTVKPTRVDGKEIDLSNPKLGISKGADTETVRIFDNKPDAEKWAEKFKDEFPENSKEKVVVLEDREIEKQAGGMSAERGVGPGSGLYTGTRADEAIPFGEEGTEAPTLGTFEALSRNVQNISNFISRNEMRQYWQQKWINTAQSLGVRSERFGDIPSNVNKETAFHLNKLKQAIDDWSGIPSDSERWMEAATQRMIDKIAGEKVLGEAGTRAGKNVLHNFKHKDPVATARAAAFHSLLGWFNPVQMWVQAQGATVALSMNIASPQRMSKVLVDQFALSAVDFVDNSEHLTNVANKLGKSPSRVQNIKRLWQKTGYRNSILNTADHAAAVQSYGVGSDSFRRLADKGLMFYRMGELFNRRVSFLTALDEYSRRTGKALEEIGDNDLGEVMTRANDFMLNLSRSNRAQWQRGPMGLPTQFQQVNAKLIETIVGSNKRFSKTERGKILAGQMGLYGVAGVPFGSAGYHAVAGLAGFDESEQAEMSDDFKRSVNGGFTDWLAYNAFGADVDVSNRSTIAQGIEQFFYDLFSDPAQFVTNMPFISTAERGWSAFKHMGVLAAPALEDGQMPSPDVALSVISEFGKIASSWDQMTKANYMHRWNQLLDRNRRALVNKDFSLSTEIAQAIGFRPREANVTYELESVNRSNKETLNKISSQIVFVMSKYADQVKDREYEDIDQETLNYYQSAVQHLYSLARNEREEETIRNSVMNKIKTGQDRYSRAMKDWVKDRSEEQSFRISEYGSKITARPFTIMLDEESEE